MRPHKFAYIGISLTDDSVWLVERPIKGHCRVDNLCIAWWNVIVLDFMKFYSKALYQYNNPKCIYIIDQLYYELTFLSSNLLIYINY